MYKVGGKFRLLKSFFCEPNVAYAILKLVIVIAILGSIVYLFSRRGSNKG